MPEAGLFVRSQAKAGEEKGVAKILETGLALANQEAITLLWSCRKGWVYVF